MCNLIKTIQYADALCDSIPIVSTITNGAQLLYKAARKVETAANPIITPGFKTELKIHVLTKDSFLSKACMIPFLGNILGLIILYFTYKHAGSAYPEQLSLVFDTNDKELVKLRLAGMDDKQKDAALRISCMRSNEETFELSLGLRDSWEERPLLDALFASMQRTPAANIEKLLKLLPPKHIPRSNEKAIQQLLSSIKTRLENGEPSTAKKLAQLLPPFPFDIALKFHLKRYVLPLTEIDLLFFDLIWEKCEPITAKVVSSAQNNWLAGFQEAKHFDIATQMIKKMLDKLSPGKQCEIATEALRKLSIYKNPKADNAKAMLIRVLRANKFLKKTDVEEKRAS
jgi:hypothetical protein